jgi:protein O-GlcNAc transferase
MINNSEKLVQAVNLHKSGDVAGARKLYSEIVESDPENADALRLTGLALRQLGDKAGAVEFLRTAYGLKPGSFFFCKDLADALMEEKCFEEAAGLYKCALGIQPVNAGLWFTAAAAYYGYRDLDNSLAALHKAIEIKPDFFEALCNIAEIYRHKGNAESALSFLERALSLKPDIPAFHNMAGLLCYETGSLQRARHHYALALQLDINFADAHNNLGNVLAAEKKFDAAINSYKEAIRLRPDFFEAYYNLGNCLRDMKNTDEALVCFRSALRIRPNSVQALMNCGEALMVSGNVREAEQYFRSIVKGNGCKSPEVISSLLLCLNYNVDYSPAVLYEEHSVFGKAFVKDGMDAGSDSALPAAALINRTTENCGGEKNIDISIFSDPIRKLNVGYVSPDFCDHPVAKFIEPILSNHNHEKFEIFCYAGNSREDSVSRRLRGLRVNWRYIKGFKDSDIAKIICKDRIDILVDLAGHTSGNRLDVFALKPAPLQISYCGYPNTTGLAAIDYYITDIVADPEGYDDFYTEQLLRIPGCFCCFQPPSSPDVNTLPALANKHITFGSFHPLMRINDSVIDLWCSVLRAVPDSKLKIARDTLNGTARKRIEESFIKCGIASYRLDFVNRIPEGGNLCLFHDIDISLDTLPWSGHTFACESLWMGVPVISLIGNRHAGRMVASVLKNMGMSWLVASTPDEYCSIARKLSGDMDTLKFLRESLRYNMLKSILCDGPGFTLKLEELYRNIWIQRCGEAI